MINLKDSSFIAYNIWINFSNSFHNEHIRNMIGLLGNIFSKDVLYCWYVMIDFRGGNQCAINDKVNSDTLKALNITAVCL